MFCRRPKTTKRLKQQIFRRQYFLINFSGNSWPVQFVEGNQCWFGILNKLPSLLLCVLFLPRSIFMNTQKKSKNNWKWKGFRGFPRNLWVGLNIKNITFFSIFLIGKIAFFVFLIFFLQNHKHYHNLIFLQLKKNKKDCQLM